MQVATSEVGARILGKWGDSLTSATTGIGASAVAAKVVAGLTSLRGLCLRYDQDDRLDYIQEMGHEWDFGGVVIHCHFMPLAPVTGTPTVRLRVQWAWVDGGAIAAEQSATVSVVLGAGDYRKKINADLAAVEPPAAPSSSTFLVYSVTRLGSSDALDTYQDNDSVSPVQANVWLMGGGIHRQINRLGTDTVTV
jgi:hypothetical protein